MSKILCQFKCSHINQELSKFITEVFNQNRYVYGIRRIGKILAKNGIFISRRRISKLMKSAGLYCKMKRRFKVTTDSRHNKLISPNLRAWFGTLTEDLNMPVTAIDLF